MDKIVKDIISENLFNAHILISHSIGEIIVTADYADENNKIHDLLKALENEKDVIGHLMSDVKHGKY